MKKKFQVPEYDFIVFDKQDVVSTSGCQTYCDDAQCQVCDYLVCEPRDVIIG